MQTWVAPRGKTMAYLFCVGGGAGGGGGLTGASTTARGGGGGGGGACISRLIVPIFTMPQRLQMQVGNGGAGGAAGAAGGTPLESFVSVHSHTLQSNLILTSGSAGNEPSGGGGGTAGAGGTAGSGGVASTVGSMPLAGLGVLGSSLPTGQNGVTGGFASDGTDITIPVVGGFCMGGAGGAGVTNVSTSFIGGGITPVANSKLSEDRPADPAAGTFDGSSATSYWKPFFSYGGLGGSSIDAAAGGNGGSGGYGSGGGGGGGGTTGGRGGNGGNGLVIVIAW